ncbi:MAG: PIN domain-containing protein [Bacteroidales bacterium]|nr:PIN domain-containing protein [Bacteroidales bacterium]
MGKVKYKIFLDTNVLLDVLCPDNRPSSEASRIIFQAVYTGLMEAVITTQSILDAAYILSRVNDHFDREAFGRCVLSMMDFMTIDSIHIFDIRDAILRPGKDLEDDAQAEHAQAEGCDAIITSDRDFRRRSDGSGILFFSPEEFVELMRPNRQPHNVHRR